MRALFENEWLAFSCLTHKNLAVHHCFGMMHVGLGRTILAGLLGMNHGARNVAQPLISMHFNRSEHVAVVLVTDSCVCGVLTHIGFSL